MVMLLECKEVCHFTLDTRQWSLTSVECVRERERSQYFPFYHAAIKRNIV